MKRDPDEPRFYVPYPWVWVILAIGVLWLWFIRFVLMFILSELYIAGVDV